MFRLHALARLPAFRWLLAAVTMIIVPAASAGLAPAAPAQAATYVYLTFDDGPSSPYTSQIVGILKTYQVKATFFETGQHVTSLPSVTRLVRSGGGSVQNHTWGHKNLTKVTWSYFKYPVTAADSGHPRADRVHTPLPAAPLRCGQQDRLLAGSVAWQDDRPVDPGSAGLDAAGQRHHHPPRPEQRAAGSGILLHDGGGIRSQTVAALRAILKDAQGTRICVPHILVLTGPGRFQRVRVTLGMC
jgi:hypothetical protein